MSWPENDGVMLHPPPAWWRPLAWPAWSLVLRPVELRDAAPVARVLTDEIARWIGLESADAMRAGTGAWAEEASGLAARGDAFRYVIEKEGRLSGAIEVRRDPIRGHIGYWLRRMERGKGSATQSLHIVLAVAFDGMGLRAADLTADAENAPSIAVMKRAGGRLIGTSPSQTVPSRTAEARYRITRTRWRKPVDGPVCLRDVLT